MPLIDIPIINYHKLEVRADIGLTARHPAQFRKDLELLAGQGYSLITFSDIADEKSLPPKPLIITFDDGYESVYTHAFPVMREKNLKGVIYIPAGYIGRENDWDVQFSGKRYRHLSADQIRELHQAGFEIGSHGMTHRLMRTMTRERLIQELSQSRRILEDLTGAEVYSISYPFGRFNRNVLEETAACGYRFGVGLMCFTGTDPSLGRLALRRFNIYRCDSDKTLLEKASGRYISLIGARDWLIQRGGMATAIYQDLFLKDDRNNTNYKIQNTV